MLDHRKMFEDLRHTCSQLCDRAEELRKEIAKAKEDR